MSIELVYLMKGVMIMLVVLLAITLFVFFVVDLLRYFCMKEAASWLEFIFFTCRHIYEGLTIFFTLCLIFCKSIDHDLEMLAIRIQHLQDKQKC